MKATLEFNLDELDDRVAHLRATLATDLALCLYAIKDELRTKVKYAPDSISEDEYATWVKAQKMVFEQLSIHNIDLDKILL
jgi:hypothetical protein